MADESATPDPVGQVLSLVAAANRTGCDAQASIYAPDAVYDVSRMGLGIYVGRAAIHDLFEEALGPYDEVLIEVEENLDLGNGAGFAVFLLTGRLVGSRSELRMRYAGIGLWANGLIARGTVYIDIDEARAAAERLAQKGGRRCRSGTWNSIVEVSRRLTPANSPTRFSRKSVRQSSGWKTPRPR
jgi:ketosteroid isomerase-like protein